MRLSIIIVNFNVKHFLEQCLCSVKTAMGGLEAEVIVVDNNSNDNSVPYLLALFPWVTFIQNSANVGFAKANNQAIKIARGTHILFLNPDTLLPVPCLKSCIEFLENTPGAGALGVRMIDGSGQFLPESKRAFPAPLTSLFKLLGFAAAMPRSKIFGRYHLGHLSPVRTHEVDVLAGAFMMVKKDVLDQVGYFDETFFMYGEDVDLSYRIQEAGWKNFYFAETSIIHFKGESTKKGSLNYVRMFYQAMRVFVQKHYGSGKARFFKIFIQFAIWLRAGLSAAGRFIKWMGLPLADIFITLGCISLVAWFWKVVVKPGIMYRQEVILVVLPLFTLMFILAGGVAGLYDKWYRPGRAWLAMTGAVIFNLAVYSLLDVDYRFSRGVILFGGLLASAVILLFRYLLVKNHLIITEDEQREFRRTLVAGGSESYHKVLQLMQLAGRHERILGRVGVNPNEPNTAGSFDQMGTLLSTIPAKEIVFCIDGQLTLQMVMNFLQQEKRKIRYKFYYEHSNSIVGSDSKESSGEALATAEYFSIDSPENRRMKKISDLAWCLFLIVFFPVHLLLMKRRAGLFSNIFKVVTGKKTWVGYCTPGEGLPTIPAAVIGCNARSVGEQLTNKESLHTIDYWYARDYEWMDDNRILLKAYRLLGS